MIPESTLHFLRNLAKNNNKTWFDTHRKEYEETKSNFEEFVKKLIDKISYFEDLGVLTPKDCMFRINRDIRFSNNKRPYKENFAAAIAKGGKKNMFGSFYLHIQPGQSFLGGGLYHSDTKTLNKFRDFILDHPKKFLSTIQSPAFKKYFGELKGETLKTAPRGYDKDLPLQQFLKMKSLTAIHNFSDQTVTSKNLESEIFKGCKLLSPYLAFIIETQK
jgi:uncharacterized protein (TIGR02453 family)